LHDSWSTTPATIQRIGDAERIAAAKRMQADGHTGIAK